MRAVEKGETTTARDLSLLRVFCCSFSSLLFIHGTDFLSAVLVQYIYTYDPLTVFVFVAFSRITLPFYFPLLCAPISLLSLCYSIPL